MITQPARIREEKDRRDFQLGVAKRVSGNACNFELCVP